MQFDPSIHLDAAARQPEPMAEPYYSLKLASANYWAGYSGRECAPAPTYRIIKGKQVLGRYLDPFGCQACMIWAQKTYASLLKQVVISLGICGVVFAIDAVFLLFTVPLVLGLLFWRRYLYSKHYGTYYKIQEEIIRTDKPVWAPFDKVRRKFMESNPNSVWP
jgi:hypothetical protein